MSKKAFIYAFFALILVSFLNCGKDDGPKEIVLTPSISNYSPNSGAAGTVVDINGKDFGTNSSDIKVYFNDVEAIVPSVTDTKIKVEVPSSAGNGELKIVINGEELIVGSFSYTLSPEILSISPESGPFGTELTINGSEFGKEISSVIVFFTTGEAVVQSVVDDKIIVIVPEGAGTGPVNVVINEDELMGPIFTYELTPQPQSLNPIEGEVGTEITITGKEFGTEVEEVEIFFSGISAEVLSVSNTEIKAVVPEGTSSGNVTIQISGQEIPNDFVFTVVVPLRAIVSTYAGNGEEGSADGSALTSSFGEVGGIFIDAQNNMILTSGSRIRKITQSGTVSTLAGNGEGNQDGVGMDAEFDLPAGIAKDSNGDFFIADSRNHRIRKMTPAGEVTTYAGSSVGSADGTRTEATFFFPSDIVIDASDNIYITDGGNNRIRKITSDGMVITIAGSSRGDVDATGVNAQFNGPKGMVMDVMGNLLVVDQGNHKIKKITPSGVVTTLVGGAGRGEIDGPFPEASFNAPEDIAIDPEGNLIITDVFNNRIRKIDLQEGIVTTIAGSTQGYTDGIGLEAQFNRPRKVVIDASGNIFIADQSNRRIRKIAIE